MFEGQVDSPKRINLLYDDIERHQLIANLTGAMSRRYVCKACNKVFRRGVTHAYDQRFNHYTAGTPSAFEGIRIPFEECKRQFINRASFDNHTRSITKKKSVCDLRRCCAPFGPLVTRGNYECN